MRRFLVLLTTLSFVVVKLVAQERAPEDIWGEVFVGSELESYLRTLQLLGATPLYPWGIRSFSHLEVARLSPLDARLPWAARYEFGAGDRPRIKLLRPGVTLRGNSTFPFGANDGAVWAGRGLTSALDGGVSARYGAVSLTIAPLAFRAENASFALMPGDTGRRAFRELFYSGIDMPQQFGARPYGMVDPGQTTLRLDAWGVAAGVSTANIHWGPAREFPVLFGSNAAGFPHAFLGTSAPLDLHVIRLHARVLWGKLYQSAFSPDTIARGLRFGTGAVALLTLRHVPGLEIGLGRFAHRLWRDGGPTIDDVLIPFRYQYRGNVGLTVRDNQLASVFFRWALQRSGFEVYGEYGREDYNQNLRDFVQEPDHIGGYTIGFAKAYRSRNRIRVFRAEVHDLQFSVLAQGRGWAPFYTSGSISQGHTNRGQIMGSYAGLGGAGSLVALDVYQPWGRWTVTWSRVLRRQRGGFATTGQPDPKGIDVIHALGWNALFFGGRYDINGGLTAVYEFNRDFARDAFNLNAVLGVRAAWR